MKINTFKTICFIYLIASSSSALSSIPQSVYKSIYMISHKSVPGVSRGTGFIVRNNILVTNLHVLEAFLPDLDSMYITNPYGSFTIKKILNADIKSDLALLEIDQYEGPYLSLGSSIEKKEVVHAIGIFKSKLKDIKMIKIAETNIEEILTDWYYRRETLGGMSGSPIVNSDNEVVAIHRASSITLEIRGSKVKNLHDLLNTKSHDVNPSTVVKNEINKLFLQAEEQGDVDAIYAIAYMYAYGKYGIDRDNIKAKMMFTKAADKGHLLSLYHLYMDYDNKEILNMIKQAENPISKYYLGRFILRKSYEKNNSEGIRLIKKAAEDDYLPAVVLMGYLSYFDNKEEGLTWSLKATDRRDPTAQSILGLHYLMSENYEEALTWFNKSAKQNSVWGKLGVTYMLCNELVSDQDREATLNIIYYSTPILDDLSYAESLFPLKEKLIDCLEKR